MVVDLAPGHLPSCLSQPLLSFLGALAILWQDRRFENSSEFLSKELVWCLYVVYNLLQSTPLSVMCHILVHLSCIFLNFITSESCVNFAINVIAFVPVFVYY